MQKQIQLLVLTLLLGVSALAQEIRPSQLPECLPRLNVASNAPPERKQQEVRGAVDYRQNSTCFARILIQFSSRVSAPAFLNAIRTFQFQRVDKQAGSSTGSGGTTNLVSKGVTAQAIAFAAEYGALTQSVNKQVVTVSGSLGGFAAALAKQKLIQYCPGDTLRKSDTLPKRVGDPCLSRSTLDFLKRFSYGISFDTSQNSESVAATATGTPEGAAQPVVFTASRRQISAWTGRYVAWKTRDGSHAFQKKLITALSAASDPNASAEVRAAGAEYFMAFQTFANALQVKLGTAFDQELASSTQTLSSTASRVEIENAFDASAIRFVTLIEDNPVTLADAQAMLQALSIYQLTSEELVATLADEPVLTFEYNNNRPVGQDPTSTFRMIFDKGFGKLSITANAAATVYDQQPTVDKAGRWRDAQIGMQIQRDIGTLFSIPASVSATYYFQYQNGPSILNVKASEPLTNITFVNLPGTADQVFAKTGSIHVGQLRLMLSPAKSSVRFPLAVSYSNRTELIAKPAWRAQVGISYDFDALFAR